MSLLAKLRPLLVALPFVLSLAGCASADDGADPDDDTSEVADNAEALKAESAVGGHAFGLGVDAPRAVTSPLFATLKARFVEGDSHLTSARQVFYLDGFDTAKLRAWVDGTKAGALEPVVALSVLREDAHGTHLPEVSRATYRSRFATLLEQFPDVRYWGVVNEPDLEVTGSAEERAAKAVLYYADAYRVLRTCQNAHKCAASVMLVAGEFAFQGGNPDRSESFWKAYADDMTKQVKSKDHPHGVLHRFPRLWSLHPYTDTSTGRPAGTSRFTAFLGAFEKDRSLPHGYFRAWLTESGGILHLGAGCSTSAGNINGRPARQFESAKIVFRLEDDSRVDRVYWWQFQQIVGHPWDSAMVDGEGVPRAAFCALTKQPLSACKGDPYATQCKPQ